MGVGGRVSSPGRKGGLHYGGFIRWLARLPSPYYPFRRLGGAIREPSGARRRQRRPKGEDGRPNQIRG